MRLRLFFCINAAGLLPTGSTSAFGGEIFTKNYASYHSSDLQIRHQWPLELSSDFV